MPTQFGPHVNELPTAALLQVALPALATGRFTTHQQAACTAAVAATMP
jgi:hypothetical protein